MSWWGQQECKFQCKVLKTACVSRYFWKNKWTKKAWIHYYFHTLFAHLKIATGYTLMNCLITTYIFNLGVMNKIMENLKHMTLPGLLFFSRIQDSPKSEPTQSCTLSYTVCWTNAVMRKYYCLQKHSLDWTPVRTTELWGGRQVNILPA